MTALCRSQRRVEALNVFRTVREALAEEQGLDPCPELQRLQQQILAGDPALELNGEH
jgi:DNA-binding SARP family transcriptional activator